MNFNLFMALVSATFHFSFIFSQAKKNSAFHEKQAQFQLKRIINKFITNNESPSTTTSTAAITQLTTNLNSSTSASVSENFLLVGDASHNNNSGRAFIYKLSNVSWVLSQYLDISTDALSNGSFFGSGVSISSKYAVIGAPGYNHTTGAVFIYQLNNATWTLMQTLTAPASTSNTYHTERSQFGFANAISDTMCIVGAPFLENGLSISVGGVFTYTYNSTSNEWVLFNKVIMIDVAVNSQFGHSVALKGNYFVVGAPKYQFFDSTGAAFIYQKTKNSIRTLAQIQSPQNTANDYFGWSVSISSNYAVVGNSCNGQSSSSACVQAVYVHQYSCGVATQAAVQVIRPETTSFVNNITDSAAQFGYSVSVNDRLMLVGAPLANNGTGVVFLYEWYGGTWTQTSVLTSGFFSTGSGQGYGYATALSDINSNHAVVTTGDNGDGGTYTYQLTPQFDSTPSAPPSQCPDTLYYYGGTYSPTFAPTTLTPTQQPTKATEPVDANMTLTIISVVIVASVMVLYAAYCCSAHKTEGQEKQVQQSPREHWHAYYESKSSSDLTNLEKNSTTESTTFDHNHQVDSANTVNDKSDPLNAIKVNRKVRFDHPSTFWGKDKSATVDCNDVVNITTTSGGQKKKHPNKPALKRSTLTSSAPVHSHEHVNPLQMATDSDVDPDFSLSDETRGSCVQMTTMGTTTDCSESLQQNNYVVPLGLQTTEAIILAERLQRLSNGNLQLSNKLFNKPYRRR